MPEFYYKRMGLRAKAAVGLGFIVAALLFIWGSLNPEAGTFTRTDLEAYLGLTEGEFVFWMLMLAIVGFSIALALVMRERGRETGGRGGASTAAESGDPRHQSPPTDSHHHRSQKCTI